VKTICWFSINNLKTKILFSWTENQLADFLELFYFQYLRKSCENNSTPLWFRPLILIVIILIIIIITVIIIIMLILIIIIIIILLLLILILILILIIIILLLLMLRLITITIIFFQLSKCYLSILIFLQSQFSVVKYVVK